MGRLTLPPSFNVFRDPRRPWFVDAGSGIARVRPCQPAESEPGLGITRNATGRGQGCRGGLEKLV
ncbi:MAG: hypothetical protein NVSMB17_10040 [Candidatus Dormibacteria bacterium]